jgi:thermitase
MHNVLKSLVLVALLLVLGACSQVAPSQPQTTEVEIASVATVTIEATDTEEAIAAKYGAKVITFKPENGFAVLGFAEGQFTALTTTTNTDFFASPEVQGAGTRAWSSGKNAWSGGLKAWSGGKNAWSGGTTGVPVLPTENTTVWNQINLYNANLAATKFGLGVKVAVLDTGLDTSHPAFAGSLAPSSEWKDFVDNDTNPQEGGTASDAGYGHGTAVAGLILQVAPKATILPIRVLDKDGSGDLDDVVVAIDWAVQKGAKIINLSLGANVDSAALYQMVSFAASRGVLMVASSGNSGTHNALTYPARMTFWGNGINTHLFGVGSVNSNDVVSSFSNYGSALAGVAPGENLVTAFPGSQMIAATGTSFAAPLYSGAFALALSENLSMSAQNLYVHFQNGSSVRSQNGGVWTRNQTARGIYDLGSGVLNTEALIEGAKGLGNMVANPFFAQVFTWWQATSVSTAWDDAKGTVALITGRGGLEQTLTGLRPNTTYKYQLEYKLSSPTDSLTIEYFVNGAWVERNFQGTAWTKPTLTFTTGATQTTATIGVWKSSTTGTATVDNFFVAKQ